MKKFLVLVAVSVMMIFTTVACSKGQNKTLSEADRVRNIVTSYIGVEHTDEGTEFAFASEEQARDFEYYWLDHGQTVSGIVIKSRTGYYYVTVVEEDFEQVVNVLAADLSKK